MDSEPAATFDHPDCTSELTIVASFRQRGNKLLDLLKGCRVSFAQIVPDYLLSPTNAVLFICLSYHRLHPDYISHRIQSLKQHYKTRILLCLVDLEDADSVLETVTEIAFRGSMSLYLAWTYREAACILQTFKLWGNKPPDIIQGRLDSPQSKERCIDALTTVPTVNKVDSVALMKEFGTLRKLILAKKEDIAKCQGIGNRKLRQLWRALHSPIK